MLDTLKLGISLTSTQHKRIKIATQESDQWQRILYHPKSGEMRQVKVEGLVETDGESYHRELRWNIPENWNPQHNSLITEFSIPKYWYGHNIHLLENVDEVLGYFKDSLEQQFNLKRCKLPPVKSWEVLRADPCYTWRMPSQAIAQQYLESLKHLRFPRKRPAIYPTSIMFAGATYSLKFYLKLPEFRAHDMKDMVKSGVSLEWINDLEDKATGVLRVEATLRKRYLKRAGIETLADLLTPVVCLEADEELRQSAEDLEFAIDCFWDDYSADCELETDEEVFQNFAFPRKLTLKPGTESYGTDDSGKRRQYIHTKGSVNAFTVGTPLMVLEQMISKFLGDNRMMQTVDQVEAQLMQHYKPVKAARLVGIWLYVQRLGTERARENFGRQSFDYSRREMKKAGVSLTELPENVTPIDRNFYTAFKMQVPSRHSTNVVDDFRDHDNILNLKQRRYAGE